MQVNPVHALLQILRLEAQKGQPLRPQDLKQIVAAETAIASEAGRPVVSAVDSAWQSPVAGGHDVGAIPANSSRLEDLGFRLAGHTSDAINKSNHEANGRGWNYTTEKDVPRIMSHGDASTSHPPANATVVGVALPFAPSREDIRHALISGDGWPEDWGEPLRARLLREEAMQEPEPAFELGYHALVLIAVLIAAAFFTLI